MVLEGESSLNESLLTGESLPVRKQAGDAVIAGSVNTASPLVIETSHVGETTRLAGIVRLLDHAMAQKPRLAVLADRVAGWFVAGLLLAERRLSGSGTASTRTGPCGSWWPCW